MANRFRKTVNRKTYVPKVNVSVPPVQKPSINNPQSSIPTMPAPTTLSPNIDMAKVAKAVATLTPRCTVRRANAYHDLPPVDLARRRPIKQLSDSCTGFLDPNFLH